MASNLQQFKGEVRKCTCGLADDASKIGERSCKFCFNRGFLAACTACDGTGTFTAKMAGGPGTMSSTCIPCGGSGHFGVNRPADWVDAPVEVAPEEVAVA